MQEWGKTHDWNENKPRGLPPRPHFTLPRRCSPSGLPDTRPSHWACWSRYLGWDCWKSRDTIEAHNWWVSEISIFKIMPPVYRIIINNHVCWWHFSLPSQKPILVILAEWGSGHPTTVEFLAGPMKGWVQKMEARDQRPGAPASCWGPRSVWGVRAHQEISQSKGTCRKRCNHSKGQYSWLAKAR